MAEDTVETTTGKKAVEPTPEDIKKQEDARKAELKRLEAERKHKEYIEKKLKECDFKEVDDRKYSFMFDGEYFQFRIPTLLENTKIKFILSQVTSIPGHDLISSTYEIEGSGDFDLLCTTKLLTHTKVLMEKAPKDFDVEKLDEPESFELGHLILISEREFIERKKKVSPGEQ